MKIELQRLIQVQYLQICKHIKEELFFDEVFLLQIEQKKLC